MKLNFWPGGSMDKRLPLFFSAFCSLMVGSSVMRTTASFSAAGVGSGAAERIQTVVFQASASGFTPAKMEPAADLKGSGAKFIEAKHQVGATANDPEVVATADGVQAKGTTDVMAGTLLKKFNIPVATDDSVEVKKMSTPAKGPTGRDITKEAVVVTAAGKRYVILSRQAGGSKYAVAVDDTGAVVGARKILPLPGEDLPIGAGEYIRDEDKKFWAEKLSQP